MLKWYVVLLVAALPFVFARPVLAAPERAPSRAAPASASSGAVAPENAQSPAVSRPVPTQTTAGATTPTSMANEPDYPGAPREINWGKQILVTLVWVVVMSGVIYLTLKFFFARGGLIGLSGSQRRSIKVLDRQMLSHQQALVVVEVGGKVLLLGMTEQHINTLAELDREMFAASGVNGTVSAPAAGDDAIDRKLSDLFGRRS